MCSLARQQTLLYLNRIPFLKATEKYQLYKQGHSFRDIKTWSLATWQEVLQRKMRTQSLRVDLLLRGVEYDLWWKKNNRGWILFIEEEGYPCLLKEIYDPPIVLYGRGSSKSMSARAVSIVGTRRADGFGRWAAYALGQKAALEHTSVVSGLAYGIDIFSHKGALSKNGCCVAVLGTSIDRIYPKNHLPLAYNILRTGGAIISELPPCSRTCKHHFIGRNRIISALSTRTIVVQAPLSSGALATADFALEQNRNVAVHRAGIQTQYMGTNILLNEGAEYIDDF